MKSGATETSFQYLFQHLQKPDDVDIIRTTEEAYRSNKKYKIIWSHDNCDQYVHKNLPQVIDHVDLIVCPSMWAKEQYVKFRRAPENKIVVIPNGVAEMFSPPKTRKSKTAIFFSAPHKGLVPIPKIWRNVIKYHPDAHLKVFSSMSLYDNSDSHQQETELMLEAIEELQTLPNVSYSPCIDREELVDYVKDAAFFMHPNIWEETFCVSMAEAMACGCYPIVSDIGALREVSFNWGKYIPMSGRNTNTGWIVDLNFIHSFSGTMVEAFNHFDNHPDTFYASTEFLSNRTKYLYDWMKISSFWGHILSDINIARHNR